MNQTEAHERLRQLVHYRWDKNEIREILKAFPVLLNTSYRNAACDYWFVLEAAMAHSDREFSRELLQMGVDLSHAHIYFLQAARERDPLFFLFLLEFGATFPCKDVHEVVYTAFRGGNDQVMPVILQHLPSEDWIVIMMNVLLKSSFSIILDDVARYGGEPYRFQAKLRMLGMFIRNGAVEGVLCTMGKSMLDPWEQQARTFINRCMVMCVLVHGINQDRVRVPVDVLRRMNSYITHE